MLLRNCRLVPELSGGESGLHDVEISDGLISSITSPGIGKGLDSIDIGGKTLLPGLIDLHTHVLVLQRRYSPLDAYHPMRLLAKAADQTREFFDHGFTTIRGCGSPARVANVLRDMINDGIVEGPRIVSSGLIVEPTDGPAGDSLEAVCHLADGPEEFRKAVRQELSEGADFVKIYASGSALSPTGVPLQPIMDRDEIAACVRVADMKNAKVAAHAHADAAIRMCVEAGVYTIEHATYISEKTIDMISERNDNCYLVPTLAAMHVSNASPDPEEFWNKRLGAMLKACSETISKAYDMGLPLGFGTDSGPGSEQYNGGLEFKFRKEYCGMKNVDILLQATQINAKILGLSDKLGSVMPGFYADLIVVDGNPDQDIACMYVPPTMVFKAGKRVR